MKKDFIMMILPKQYTVLKNKLKKFLIGKFLELIHDEKWHQNEIERTYVSPP